MSARICVQADFQKIRMNVSFLDAQIRGPSFFHGKCATSPGVGASSAASLDCYWTLTFISPRAGETRGGGGEEGGGGGG